MDISILSLYKDFNQALLSGTLPVTRRNFTGTIQMIPEETFLQITNLSSDIAFAGAIKVELINQCEEVVKDITGLFFYKQFTDIKGTKQIAFEFAVFGIDIVVPFMLKITSLLSSEIWFSNPFYITSYNKHKTIRVDYSHPSYIYGASYDKAPYFQSGRFAMFKNDEGEKTQTGEYTQLRGRRVSFRNTTTFLDFLKMEFCDFFLFKRLRCIFNHDLIYFDGYRVSDKPILKKGDRVGQTNFFNLDIEYNPTEEKREFEYQIFEPFRLNTKIPFGRLVVSPTLGKGIFNRNFVLGTGNFYLYKGSVLIHTFTQADFTNVTNNSFEFDLTGLITDIATYNIQFGFGLFTSIYGENIKIDNSIDWAFSLTVADFDSADFSSIDFLTD